MTRRNWFLLPAIIVAAVALNGSIPPVPRPVPILPGDAKVTRVTEVRPGEVYAGEFATAYGFNLEAARAKEIWLVDGLATFKLQIMEQGDYTILFRVPNWTPAGRWQIAVVTDNEMLVEQGVFLNVRSFRGWPTG